MRWNQAAYFLFPVSNSSGQSMVILLTLLPVVLALAGTLLFTGEFLKERSQTLSECRKDLHAIHKNQINSLKELFRLNPEAKRLQKIEKALKKASRAGTSGNVVVVAGVAVSWAALKAAQAKLQIQQQKIMNRFRGESRLMISKTLSVLNENTPKSSRTDLSLPVYPSPPTSLSPTYSLLPGYSQLSKLRVDWRQSVLPKSEFFLKKLNWNSVGVQCSGSIKKEGHKWKIELT